jgi:transposase InsO family protein
VAFLDDHSRFLVSYGLHASQSAALVLEVFRAGLSSYGPPEEVLTDNGSQYVTWRGKSACTKELEKRGIRQVVAAPRHPQTLGKIERFWGTPWRECVESAIFLDLGDAQRRIGLFIDHNNFQRPHRGCGGLERGSGTLCARSATTTNWIGISPFLLLIPPGHLRQQRPTFQPFPLEAAEQ